MDNWHLWLMLMLLNPMAWVIVPAFVLFVVWAGLLVTWFPYVLIRHFRTRGEGA